MIVDSKIYFAPLQGFTDFVYRRCYCMIFGHIDEYYIPYISVGKGGKIRSSQYREILPENNGNIPAVPQILCSNEKELSFLAEEIRKCGYQKVNLNLGCPYPMVTNRARGAALLENEHVLREVLDTLFRKFDFRVSAKFRSGLENERVIFDRIKLLNEFPFEKLIFHPRTAKQLYKGKANQQLFPELLKMTDKQLVYNGDISSLADLEAIQKLAPAQNEWMIGRGILMNPFLPKLIKGETIPETERISKLKQFHELVLENYRNIFQNDGHVLNKLKEFWIYFSYNFEQQRKALKAVKKSNCLDKYLAETSNFF